MLDARGGVCKRFHIVLRGQGAAGAVLRSGEWRRIGPREAGWRFLSLRVEGLSAGDSMAVSAAGEELALVVLSGSAVVSVDGERWEIPGRASVFDGPPWAVYLPPGSAAAWEATADLAVAVVGSATERPGRPQLIPPDDVEVEIRGAGSATRRIHHILPPEFPAHRLLVVEVLTPSGNWSSFPPHKHDEDRQPEEVDLEEFYYFRIRPPVGFAFQRVYSPPRDFDLTVAVRDGDVVLVPFGYHVSGAPHGFDLYYLNGLAGEVRSMAASDDPALAYIRETWKGMKKDPRAAEGGARRNGGKG